MQEYKEIWKMQGNAILWDVSQDRDTPHEDHLEMSGNKVSVIVRYGVDQAGKLVLSRQVVWPTLRTIPNDTHGSLISDFELENLPSIWINGKKSENEKPYQFQFNGLLRVKSMDEHGMLIERVIFPSADMMSTLEKLVLTNTNGHFVTIKIVPSDFHISVKGVAGIYLIEIADDVTGEVTLGPQESFEFGIQISARNLQGMSEKLNVTLEENKRSMLTREIQKNLCLETPNSNLNLMFEFAKLRAGESIFNTKSGPMHSPGGGRYYAAIWTNDQVEYAGPFFPYLGYSLGNEATINALRLYTAFMGPDYQPIPSSIIAEGVDIWEGAGDRGDAAMYAYGAALFTLTYGNSVVAKAIWPAIVWCLNYCERQKNSEGVITSDSDELEGRFPSGSANLSTSCLTYAAYVYAVRLARSLGYEQVAENYERSAQELYAAIENYFGATVEGYETYRYFAGNDVLRSWISMPLAMGFVERKEGTIAALLSTRLWSDNGLVTQAGDTTFWDRSTLYGLRGMFIAGQTEVAASYLISYSNKRLLGNHVPYAVEAYPEGNQRQLSAESALYCRVITEGMFGIEPTGLSSFTCKPRLPEGWDQMALRSMQAFGRSTDLIVHRKGNGIELIVSDERGTFTYEGAQGTAFEIK